MKQYYKSRQFATVVVASVFLLLLLIEVAFSVGLDNPTGNVDMFYFVYLPCVGAVALALMIVDVAISKVTKAKYHYGQLLALAGIALSYFASYIQFVLSASHTGGALSYKGIDSYYGIVYNISGVVEDLTAQSQSAIAFDATIVTVHCIVVLAVWIWAVIGYGRWAKGNQC